MTPVFTAREHGREHWPLGAIQMCIDLLFCWWFDDIGSKRSMQYRKYRNNYSVCQLHLKQLWF